MRKSRWIRWVIPVFALVSVLAGCLLWGWSLRDATLPPDTIAVLDKWEQDGRQMVDLLVEDVLFEDMVYGSDAAVVAEFLDRQEYERYTEYRFRVEECLYGGVEDSEIYVYERHGFMFVDGTGEDLFEEALYGYALGRASSYRANGTYLLILNRYESILYEHDRYMSVGQTSLREDTGEYRMYRYNVRVPGGMTMREYVCKLHSAPSDIEPENPVAWYDGVNYTFEELVQKCDVILTGTYRDKERYDYYMKYRFEVQDCLYGSVEDEEIYLHTDTGEDHGARLNGGLSLDEGAEYILLLYRFQNVTYEHDRYLPLAIIRTQGGSPYSARGARLFDFTGGLSARDYVQEICERVKMPEDTEAEPAVSYENEIAEMVGESAHVGIISIESLENEGIAHSGNVYRCKAKSLLKGGGVQVEGEDGLLRYSELNTYDDGTFLLSLIKGTVEVGKSYIIGFTPADEGSLIYSQETKNSVYEVSDALLAQIEGYVTE